MKNITKKVAFVQRNHQAHWVGDGFPVRSIFSYNDLGAELSPFLLLDYGGPTRFEPTTARRGVGAHPHRGFETVTIVYDGEVEHRDSTGGGGVIRPGDVQWMTAAGGIVHSEFHGEEYAKRGGAFEMIQLWVNLPRKDKLTTPGYQSITSDVIPTVKLEGGSARVIAGELNGSKGPAHVFSPINLWDIRLEAGARVALEVPESHVTSIFTLQGRVRIGGSDPAADAELAVLDRAGTRVEIEALQATKLLLLGGEPLNEPIVGHGPFVMNTEAEIRQAFVDYQNGRMGRVAE